MFATTSCCCCCCSCCCNGASRTMLCERGGGEAGDVTPLALSDDDGAGWGGRLVAREEER
jgi:hypothetical protein